MWEYPTEEGSHDFYMDPGKEIRFRVTSDRFVDTSPSGPSDVAATAGHPEGVGVDGTKVGGEAEKRIPYMIHGSVNEPGLGLFEWWENT